MRVTGLVSEMPASIYADLLNFPFVYLFYKGRRAAASKPANQDDAATVVEKTRCDTYPTPDSNLYPVLLLSADASPPSLLQFQPFSRHYQKPGRY